MFSVKKFTIVPAAICALALATLAPLGTAAYAGMITVQGDTTSVGNCVPFGCPGTLDPVQGFVYQNIPTFDLSVGDTIALDTGGQNDYSLIFNIYLGATDANGNAVVGTQGLSLVVGNGTPSDPNGNDTVGDFELVYTVTNAFSFSGGGLIIAFETIPGTPTIMDTTVENNLVHSDAGDTSGYFVRRFYGLPSLPGAGTDLASSRGDTDNIGHFKINFTDPASNMPEGGMIALFGIGIAGLGIAARRRSHGSA